MSAFYQRGGENVGEAKELVSIRIMHTSIFCIGNEFVVYKSLNFVILTSIPNILVI